MLGFNTIHVNKSGPRCDTALAWIRDGTCIDSAITSTQVPRFRKWRRESVAHVTYLPLAGGQQQAMTRLTNTAILLAYTSRFHWGFSWNWQEHICERNIRCFGSPSHLSLGSDRLNVTVCRTCTVPLWDVQRAVGSWSYWKNILRWLAIRSSSSPYLYSTVVFSRTFWGEDGQMTVWL